MSWSDPNSKTKNYAFILDYAKDGDLHHFLNKNFVKITWKEKLNFLSDIVRAIRRIHNKKILYRDLHSGNILIKNTAFISDLGF
ncbi:1204_t:CDS:1, partial [Diversispora eburnea]